MSMETLEGSARYSLVLSSSVHGSPKAALLFDHGIKAAHESVTICEERHRQCIACLPVGQFAAAFLT